MLKYKDLEAEDVFNRDVIRRSIKNIIYIPVGTVPGRPDLGSKINKYIFSQLDELDIMDLEDYLNMLIVVNEKRVTNVISTATFSPEYNRLVIDVQYQIVLDEEIDFISFVINTQ